MPSVQAHGFLTVMSEYTNEASSAVEVSAYRPVHLQDFDDDDDVSIDLSSPRPSVIHKYPLCCQFMIRFLYHFANLLIIIDILYISFLFSLFHQRFFNHIREQLSGYTEQPQHESTNCNLTWPNIKKNMDIYLFFHFVNNFAFTLGVRNRLFMWVNSILFEIIQFLYTWFPIFNYQYNRECWYDLIIFDILVFNALGIEAALFTLKYVMRSMYPLFTDWKFAFMRFCGCNNHCKCIPQGKYILVMINLLFLLPLFQVLGFALYDYTLWVGALHWLSVIRFLIIMFSCVGVFGQVYRWIYRDVSCFSKKTWMNSYWIIIVWTIIILEFVLVLRHYLS